MSDLINRLRSGDEIHEGNWSMLDEAAEKIEAQAKEITGLQQINLTMQASYESTITEYMKLNKELALLNKELASALVESRNNDRTAMSYLHEVQAIVLSKDFPEMVKKVAGYKSLCDQLGNAMELHGTPFLHHELRYEEALTAWRNSKRISSPACTPEVRC